MAWPTVLGRKRMKASTLIAAAVATTASMQLSANAGPAPPPPFNAEKCYSIADAGKNDCQTATHACAGEAQIPADPASWMYVPKGTCVKIYHGSLASK